MKKIIIIGASGHAKVVIDIIEKQNEFEIFGLIDSYKKVGEEIFGYKILGTEEDISNLKTTHNIYGGIIAIGDNWTRMSMYHKIIGVSKDFKFISAIHPGATLGKNIFIDEGTVIMPGVIINSDANVGKFCIINTNSSLGHDGMMKDFSSVAPGVTIGGSVTIGKSTAISLGASIIHNVSIGNYSIIGSGALIVEDVDDFKLVHGSPGKVIKTLKKGHKLF